jgi:hypothetical protein
MDLVASKRKIVLKNQLRAEEIVVEKAISKQYNMIFI